MDPHYKPGTGNHYPGESELGDASLGQRRQEVLRCSLGGQGALIFDLQKPIPARQRSSFLSADDILQTYKKAAQDMCLVPLNAMDAGIDNAQFISISA